MNLKAFVFFGGGGGEMSTVTFKSIHLYGALKLDLQLFKAKRLAWPDFSWCYSLGWICQQWHLKYFQVFESHLQYSCNVVRINTPWSPEDPMANICKMTGRFSHEFRKYQVPLAPLAHPTSILEHWTKDGSSLALHGAPRSTTTAICIHLLATIGETLAWSLYSLARCKGFWRGRITVEKPGDLHLKSPNCRIEKHAQS